MTASSPVGAPESQTGSSYGYSGGGGSTEVRIPCGCIVIPLIIVGLSVFFDIKKNADDSEDAQNVGGWQTLEDAPEYVRPVIFVEDDVLMYEAPTSESEGQPVSENAIFFLHHTDPVAREWMRDDFCYATPRSITSREMTFPPTIDTDPATDPELELPDEPPDFGLHFLSEDDTEPAGDIGGGWIHKEAARIWLHRQTLLFQPTSDRSSVEFYRTKDDLVQAYAVDNASPDTLVLDSADAYLYPILQAETVDLGGPEGTVYQVGTVDLSGQGEHIRWLFVCEIDREGNDNFDRFALVQREQLRQYIEVLERSGAILMSAEDADSDGVAEIADEVLVATVAVNSGLPIDTQESSSVMMKWAESLPVQIDGFSVDRAKVSRMTPREFYSWPRRLTQRAQDLRRHLENHGLWKQLGSPDEQFSTVNVDAFP